MKTPVDVKPNILTIMKGIMITPEDIGAIASWDDKWVAFCRKLGHVTTPNFVIIVEINVEGI